MKRVKVIMLSLAVLASLALVNICQAAGSGDPDNKFGLEGSASTAFGGKDNIPLKDAASASGISVLIGRAVGIVLGFLGALFFGLIVYAGLKWMTARGNDTQIKDAQKIMRAAIVGLAIVLGAYAITRIMGEILK
jgi:hypothetical protein